MKAVLYARYSTEGQREASVDDQFRNCERRAAQEGWTITCAARTTSCRAIISTAARGTGTAVPPTAPTS
jgi:site-specific DNA recombinase